MVSDLILENKGKFEKSRKCNIRQYRTYGTRVKRQLYASDEKERYFHLFYSDYKAAAEREQIDTRMERMMRYLDSLKGQKAAISEGYKEYFHLETYEEDGTFLFAKEKEGVIERERD